MVSICTSIYVRYLIQVLRWLEQKSETGRQGRAQNETTQMFASAVENAEMEKEIRTYKQYHRAHYIRTYLHTSDCDCGTAVTVLVVNYNQLGYCGSQIGLL